jgi:hypothetical protein
MARKILHMLPLFILLLVFSQGLFSQNWEFIKEKDGIKVYTRTEKNSALKSFKGVTDMRTTMEKICTMIGNPNNREWWDKNLSEVKVLSIEKNKYSFYMVIDLPWPVSDRDLCVETRISTDSVTGIRTVYAQQLLNVVPEKPDRIRIKKYWQKWTIQPKGNNIIHLELEGFVDPAGSIPAWLYNMVLTDTPLKIMREIQKRAVNPVSQ